MAAIKGLADSASKWNRRASAAASDLVKGVQNPKKSWSESSKAAEDNYVQGVTLAANEGRYGAGIDAAGEQKWQTNSVAKAQTRYPQGVQLAQGEWQKGFTPYHQAYSAHNLSPRGPRGSEQNYALSTEVQRLFAATKRARA